MPVSDQLNRTTIAFGRPGDRIAGISWRIGTRWNEPVQDCRAHDLVIRAVDCRAVTTARIVDRWELSLA